MSKAKQGKGENGSKSGKRGRHTGSKSGKHKVYKVEPKPKPKPCWTYDSTEDEFEEEKTLKLRVSADKRRAERDATRRKEGPQTSSAKNLTNEPSDVQFSAATSSSRPKDYSKTTRFTQYAERARHEEGTSTALLSSSSESLTTHRQRQKAKKHSKGSSTRHRAGPHWRKSDPRESGSDINDDAFEGDDERESSAGNHVQFRDEARRVSGKPTVKRHLRRNEERASTDSDDSYCEPEMARPHTPVFGPVIPQKQRRPDTPDQFARPRNIAQEIRERARTIRTRSPTDLLFYGPSAALRVFDITAPSTRRAQIRRERAQTGQTASAPRDVPKPLNLMSRLPPILPQDISKRSLVGQPQYTQAGRHARDQRYDERYTDDRRASRYGEQVRAQAQALINFSRKENEISRTVRQEKIDAGWDAYT